MKVFAVFVAACAVLSQVTCYNAGRQYSDVAVDGYDPTNPKSSEVYKRDNSEEWNKPIAEMPDAQPFVRKIINRLEVSDTISEEAKPEILNKFVESLESCRAPDGFDRACGGRKVGIAMQWIKIAEQERHHRPGQNHGHRIF